MKIETHGGEPASISERSPACVMTSIDGSPFAHWPLHRGSVSGLDDMQPILLPMQMRSIKNFQDQNTIAGPTVQQPDAVRIRRIGA
jgi:hypothetical protein